MPSIAEHDRRTLPLNTDVAEWCPTPQAASLLAVGTYQLDEATQQRLGRLHMYGLCKGAPPPAAAADQRAAAADEHAGATASDAASNQQPGQQQLHLQELSTLELPGVFDLRWHPRSAMPQLAAALADGSVRVLAWPGAAAELAACTEPPQASLLDPGEEPPEGMAVSLDWARAAGGEGERLAASFSSGQLQLFQAAPAGLASLAVWQAHELEAWAASTDHWHPDLIHSGGDDAAYRLWDARQGFDAPVWQDRRTHGAGVCCAASSPHQQAHVCTGSYDDRIRLWDLRAPRRPLLQAELDLGGGVWRAKWHPTDPCLLLAACMYNGFAVLQVDGQQGSLQVLHTYEHAPGSLSYGADWCQGAAAAVAGDDGGGEGGGDAGDGGASVAATASFYDRQLRLWSFCP